jgi:hypothetical protein
MQPELHLICEAAAAQPPEGHPQPPEQAVVQLPRPFNDADAPGSGPNGAMFAEKQARSRFGTTDTESTFLVVTVISMDVRNMTLGKCKGL